MLGEVFAKSREKVMAPLWFFTPSPLYDSTDNIAKGTLNIHAKTSPTLIPPLAIQTT